MRIHKKGFTLAEVLITLGIVSVIAALTIPQISGNAQKKRSGAALSKIHHNIEAKAKEYMYNYNTDHNSFIDKIALTNDWQNEFLGSNGLYMYLIPNSNNTYKMNKTPGEFQLEFRNIAETSRYYPTTAILNITVDLNGFNKGPNSSGHDRFAFYMSNNGELYPNDDATKEVVNNGFVLR